MSVIKIGFKGLGLREHLVYVILLMLLERSNRSLLLWLFCGACRIFCIFKFFIYISHLLRRRRFIHLRVLEKTLICSHRIIFFRRLDIVSWSCGIVRGILCRRLWVLF